MKRTTALALASLAAAACDTGFEPQYRVTDLRILGVRAEVVGSTAADVSPGDALQLEALVANPRGRTGLTVRWFACAPSGTDALPPCADEAFLRTPEALVGAAGVLELPRGSGTGERPPEVPLSILPDALVDAALAAVRARAAAEPTYQCSLYVEIPIVVVAEAEGRREVALKRVRLTPPDAGLGAYVRNLNPSVGTVLRSPDDPDACTGGADLESAPYPGGRTVVCARAASGAVGQYAECGPEGPIALRHESLSWQWFVTAGEFPEEDGVGNATGNNPEFERPAGPFTLWVILRDGRGGEGWARRDVGAAP